MTTMVQKEKKTLRDKLVEICEANEALIMWFTTLFGWAVLAVLLLFGIGWLSDVVFGKMTTGQYIQKVRWQVTKVAEEWPLKLQTAFQRVSDVNIPSENLSGEVGHGSIASDTPFNFVMAVIQSIHWSWDAKETLSSSPLTGSEPDFYLQAMTTMRSGMSKLQLARNRVAPFVDSQNKYIHTSAKGFNTAYTILLTSIGNSLGVLEKMGNMSDEEAALQIGTISKEASEHLTKTDEGWKLLTYAAVGTTYVLVDNEREEDGKRPYLMITADEKAALLKELDKLFGDRIKGGLQAGQHGTLGAAAVLWQFLTQEGWKPSDMESSDDDPLGLFKAPAQPQPIQ